MLSTHPPPSPSGCPGDIILLDQVGPNYENVPIRLISQDLYSVSIELSSPVLSDDLEYLYFNYAGEHYENKCEKRDNVDTEYAEIFEIDCHESDPTTLIRVYASDQGFYSESSQGAIPDCSCQGDDLPSAYYVFLVSCVSKCPITTMGDEEMEDTMRRR